MTSTHYINRRLIVINSKSLSYRVIPIKKENLLMFKSETTFTTGWLDKEIEEIKSKSRPNLAEILMVNLRKKLLQSRPCTQDTSIPPNFRIEERLKRYGGPFKRNILKLENQQA